MSQELRVHLDGTLAGSFFQTSNGSLEFRYDDGYRASNNPTPLSLSMPFASTKHANKAVRSWLSGLLPDNDAVLERWARQYGVSANNPFALLRHVGRDAAGAVQFLPPDDGPDDAAERRGDIEWLADGDVVEMLRELARHGTDWNPGRRAGRWSLAGAQAKLALHRDPDTARWGIPRDSTPTTHILKPAIRGLDDHHINEVLSLRVARRLGLPAAEVVLLEAEDVQAMVSVRYDRVRGSDGQYRRLHQEDLCQALSVPPSLKYQEDGGPGVGHVADLLGRLDLRDRQASRERFFDGLAFSVTIEGTDAHAKNYSLLLAGSRATIAPLYDVASAAPYRNDTASKSSMKVGDHWTMREISETDWEKAARRLGLDPAWAVHRVRQFREGVPDAFHAEAEELPASLRDRAGRIAEAVELHVQSLAGTWGERA